VVIVAGRKEGVSAAPDRHCAWLHSPLLLATAYRMQTPKLQLGINQRSLDFYSTRVAMLDYMEWEGCFKSKRLDMVARQFAGQAHKSSIYCV